MKEINLLKHYPVSNRPIEERGEQITEYERSIARKFDIEYFDGDRLTGYGGYEYHSRFWTETVKYIAKTYNLSNSSKILDVGCAKGYMMYDLQQLLPQADIQGVDISDYAKRNAKSQVRDQIKVCSANNLPFKDDEFDLVIAINTLHNLPLIDCKQAFREINRVSKNHSFVMNDAWRDDAGMQSMLKWNLTALTYMSCDDWIKLFEEVNYQGDYYWFFAA
jgi:ubiquinone/menaquinone biosynthesis C-methylase UbiE